MDARYLGINDKAKAAETADKANTVEWAGIVGAPAVVPSLDWAKAVRFTYSSLAFANRRYYRTVPFDCYAWFSADNDLARVYPNSAANNASAFIRLSSDSGEYGGFPLKGGDTIYFDGEVNGCFVPILEEVSNV